MNHAARFWIFNESVVENKILLFTLLMPLPALVFILLIIAPSYIFALAFRNFKVPLKISLADYKAPPQILLLGVVLPALPYSLAYAVVRMFDSLNFFTPLKVFIGLLKLENIHWGNRSWPWLLFFLGYYFFCFVEAVLISKASKTAGLWKSIIILFDKLQILDEQEYLAQQSAKILTEIDLTVIGSQFVYSGTIEKIRTNKWLNQDCIQLTNVLKIPMDKADTDLANYLKEALQSKGTDSREWLKTMLFPKDKINTLNLRVEKAREFEITNVSTFSK